METIPIALLITELDRGGAEKIFCELARSLDPNRYSPSVYLLRSRSYHRKENLISKIEEKGIPVTFLDIRGFFSFFRALFRLAFLLRRRKTKILQSFMFHANIIGRFAAFLARVPVVCSGLRVSEKERLVHLRIDRFTSFLVDRAVCVSQSVAEYSARIGKLSPKQLVVIPNAVRVENNHEPSLREESFPPLFYREKGVYHAVVIGRLTRQKGLDWLLTTAPRWLNSRVSPGWRLWLVGAGEEETSLRALANSLPEEISERIHFAGWRSDISQILSSTDLFLLPSRWEGMPNALLEAAAAGCALLSTTCDGVEEILGKDLSREETAPFGDEDLWCERILPLLADQERRSALGRANRERVEKFFSLEAMVKKYDALWEELLHTKQK